MKTTAVKVLGPEAEQMNRVWNVDDEGELVMWRDSGHRKSFIFYLDISDQLMRLLPAGIYA